MKKYEDRWYQTEAKDALLTDIVDHNPLIAVPTGAGKTVILCKFVIEFMAKYPIANFLIIANVEEILEQDHAALSSFFPGVRIGLYSAGLKSKSIEKITVAGIQSIYRKPELFDNFQIAFIDEAHTVPFDNKSMFRKFFNGSKIHRYVGMTATIFRKGVGYIHKGKDRIFDKLSYDLTGITNFNKLTSEGYLSKLVSKPSAILLETDGVKTTAGDFNVKQLSMKNDRAEITQAAVNELIEYGHKNYKSWLVFAIDIDHADNINEELIKRGIKSRALHSGTKKSRKEIINEFKQFKIQAVVSVGMVTTGFDAPNIDLICLLRPTKSSVLHVQMIGRGLRIFPNKTHCLVMDFSGNVERLGPINNVTIPTRKGEKKETGEAPIKICPDCGCHQYTMIKICDVCGHEFEFKQKIQTKATNVDIVQYEKLSWYNVESVHYHIHYKIGRPESIRVVYIHRLGSFTEYVCIEHGGYAQLKAENWLRYRWTGNDEIPKNAIDVCKNSANLKTPIRICVDMSGKYKNIIDADFSKKNVDIAV